MFLLRLHKTLLLGFFLVYCSALIPGSLHLGFLFISLIYNIASPLEGLVLAKGLLASYFFKLGG